MRRLRNLFGTSSSVTVLLLVIGLTASIAGVFSGYLLVTPQGADSVLILDVSDTSESASGSTRRARLDALPVSTPVATAIGLKQDASTAATDSELTAGLATKQNSATAATDAELASHEGNAGLHNAGCTPGSGDCGLISSGNTVTYSVTLASGECHRWQEFIGGNWYWYRQCYGDAVPTEETYDWLAELGNYTLPGSWDHSTGEILVPTQGLDDNSNAAASTAFVRAYVASILGSAGVDIYPDAFPFTSVVDATLSTEYCDNATIEGIDSTAPISFAGAGTYQINSGTKVTSSGTVALNDVITNCITASGSNLTTLSNTVTVGGRSEGFSVTTVAGGGSVCSGDVTFDWTMTADFVTGADITGSGGCSIGDDTVTLESAASGETAPTGRTGYALYIPGGYDVASFDLGTLWNYSEGELHFEIYIATWANSGWLFSVVGQASEDQFLVMLYDTDDIRVEYEGANSGPVRATTTTAGLTTGTWYSGVVKWRSGATDPSIQVEINGATATATTDLAAWDTAATELNFGNAGGVAPAFYLKNLRIYNSWQ